MTDNELKELFTKVIDNLILVMKDIRAHSEIDHYSRQITKMSYLLNKLKN